MAKKFTLDALTEGLRQRHVGEKNRQLVEKWNRTGLLRGLDGTHRENMAQMLENQASQVLREQSTLGSGVAANSDIRGFTNIAFPIVRRVFGGLIANELVSIQPMSLPSGLLFYLDYTYGTNLGDGDATSATSGQLGDASDNVYTKGDSIYNNPPGSGVRSGSLATGGLYDLAGMGYSRSRRASNATLSTNGAYAFNSGNQAAAASATNFAHATGSDGVLLQFDPQVAGLIENAASPDAPGHFFFAIFPLSGLTSPDLTLAKEIAVMPTGSTPTTLNDTVASIPNSIQGGDGVYNIRRLNQIGTWTSGTRTFTSNPLQPQASAYLLAVMSGSGLTAASEDFGLNYVRSAATNSSDLSTIVSPAFESDFESTPAPAIPEIDIKIQSVAVVAQTRKLRARWSPELAQDLNAYHSLDAEVELTQILSEQIAMEIDREILNDLLTEGNGAKFYWSRMPGKFINKRTGAVVQRDTTINPGPAFAGTVREWYETLIETIIDVANEIHRKTLRGSANFIVVSPEVATILESSILYRPSLSLDGDGQVGQSDDAIGC